MISVIAQPVGPLFAGLAPQPGEAADFPHKAPQFRVDADGDEIISVAP
jgi:hypothetical protein